MELEIPPSNPGEPKIKGRKMKDDVKFPAMEKTYHIMSVAFCVIVVLSNIISAKMVALPYLGFSIPAGLVTYPFTFLLSDLVTEFFGAKKAKLMVYIALGMNLLSFGIIELALWLPTDIPDAQNAFRMVIGLSGLRIFSSLTAYAIAQLADIQLYALIKKWTGPRFLWLRNNASTCISQMIDTATIDIIFLYWGLNREIQHVLPIMIFSYIYKILFSISTTPLFYFCVFILQKQWKKTTLLSAQNLSLAND